MEKKDLIEKEVGKTLKVIDRIERVDVNPFLFGKIIQRLDEVNPIEKKLNFKFALTVVVMCLIINFAAIFFVSDNNNSTNYTNVNTDSARVVQIESFASEYSSTGNFYFY
jgi:hypothetical protein